MCWVLGNVCHHHQRAQQTRVDIIYQHSQSWKLMPRRGWVKCFLSSSYEIMNDSWFFWQQLDNSRWHQVVLPQHKTEIKHTPSNHPNWVPPWTYGLRRLKSKMKMVYKKHVSCTGNYGGSSEAGESLPELGRVGVPCLWTGCHHQCMKTNTKDKIETWDWTSNIETKIKHWVWNSD